MKNERWLTSLGATKRGRLEAGLGDNFERFLARVERLTAEESLALGAAWTARVRAEPHPSPRFDLSDTRAIAAKLSLSLAFAPAAYLVDPDYDVRDPWSANSDHLCAFHACDEAAHSFAVADPQTARWWRAPWDAVIEDEPA